MRNLSRILILLFGVLTPNVLAVQQQQILKSLPGEVIAVNAANNELKLKTSAGGETVVLFDAKTEFKRLSPDKLSDPNSAVAASLADISVGDKIVAVGALSADKKTIGQTRRIFLLTKTDIAKKQEADQARWITRGVAGRVISFDATSKTITVGLRGGGGGSSSGAGSLGAERTMSVTASDKTIFHRYAPNSVKFVDAQNSNFSELKIGDQLRAVGEKSADNNSLRAEEILFGSFRMVAGKITAIDAARGEIIVKDLQTKNDVTIAVNRETLLRRFPPEMAERMAKMQAIRAASTTSSANSSAAGGAQSPATSSGGGGGARVPTVSAINGNNEAGGVGAGITGRRGGGDLDSMLEQLPALSLTELKIGDAVAATSSSSVASPNHVTAFKFVAGIEPFLVAPQLPTAFPNRNRPQSPPSINIPGLDGIGAP